MSIVADEVGISSATRIEISFPNEENSPARRGRRTLVLGPPVAGLERPLRNNPSMRAAVYGVWDIEVVRDLFTRLGLLGELVGAALAIKGEQSVYPGWTLERSLFHRTTPRMDVTRLSLNSPLAVEIATATLGTGSVGGAVVYLFKYPEKIGSWFPRLKKGWYDGEKAAEEARQHLEALRQAGAEMKELA